MNKYLIGLIAVVGGVLVGILFRLGFGERVVTMDWLIAIFVALGAYATLIRRKKDN